jgi:WXG100 family type VII secretion target
MASITIRIHYDEVDLAVKKLKQQAADYQALQSKLKNELDGLVPNNWQGDAASKFKREMEDQVLPSLNKLIHALNDAADTASKIHSHIHTADEACQAHFKNIQTVKIQW